MRTLAASLALTLAIVAGCSRADSDLPVASAPLDSTVTTPATSAAPDTTAPTTTLPPSTTAAVEPLTILVTNDDGVSAPGIDELVTQLEALPDVEVIVVAPATNQSGTADTTTPGGVTAQDATTLSGHPAVAVDGYPADAVNHALDVMSLRPDVVVAGANAGQNVGPFVAISGTIGAARTAARRGVPAIAVSAGGLSGSDFATAARVAVEEVADLRTALGWGNNTEHTVVNLNTPTCAPGTQMRGVADVPVAAAFPAGSNGLDLVFDCASPALNPADDVAALLTGYAARTTVDAD